MRSFMFAVLLCGVTPIATLAETQQNPCGQLASKLDPGRLVVIPGHLSGQVVGGQGRLYFHSAPTPRCKTQTFIVPGDTVDAIEEYMGFSNITYINPRTGRIATGWVESKRLKATGMGIAPSQ